MITFIALQKTKNTTTPPPKPMSTLHLLVLFLLCPTQSQSATSPRSTYIVHVSKPRQPTPLSSSHDWYTSILHSLTTTTNSQPNLLYSYTNSATGFSATLTPAQVIELRHHPAVISVVPDEVHHLHTTRTYKFMDLNDGDGLWLVSGYGSNIVIGVLDTGIWPDSRCFSDFEYDPVPDSWGGVCEEGPDFPVTSCNRKIIGARIFYKGYEARHGPMNETKSARDTKGHGTHTASTAAGTIAHNAAFYHYARGTAMGIAAKSRISVYKTCWKLGCYDSDILAAIDRALDDGVHVISLSIGAKKARPYDHDAIAIGALHAAQRGVVVSCSVGNSGPEAFTAVNVAPWILTVGASTIDREFTANVELGNGRVFHGVTLYCPVGDEDVDQNTYWELVYAGNSGNRFCQEGKLDSSKVAGRIVICDRGSNRRTAKGYAVKQAGGAAMIIVNTAKHGEELIADPHLLPATMVGQIAGNEIKQYLSTSHDPTAKINFKGTTISTKPPAPMIAAFSSRGPNLISPEIIKPDVVAPGVNILAGWTKAVGPSGLNVDKRKVEFNIISGTSMACPHVSGLAGLLKNANPTWSPAAIKSALMTTAYHIDNNRKNMTDLGTGKNSTAFIHGSGHVDPNKALDPGLVYDTDVSEYVGFLCSVGYDSKKIQIFLKEQTNDIDCRAHNMSNSSNLNYPSFSIVFKNGQSNVVRAMRKVTHVGSYLSNKVVYMANIIEPPNVKVKVTPNVLEFNAQRRISTYKVSFTSTKGTYLDRQSSDSYGFGSIEWSDGIRHSVRSPIAVRWVEKTEQQLPFASI